MIRDGILRNGIRVSEILQQHFWCLQEKHCERLVGLLPMSQDFSPGVEVVFQEQSSWGRSETRLGDEEGDLFYQFSVIRLANNFW